MLFGDFCNKEIQCNKEKSGSLKKVAKNSPKLLFKNVFNFTLRP